MPMSDGWYKEATVTDAVRFRFRLGGVTLSEAEVASTIQHMMGMAAPNALYWALVNSMGDLAELKRRADAEAAERMRKRQRWEDAKWSDDTNGFETSGSAKADGFEFASGGKHRDYDGFFAEAFRRMQEEAIRKAAYGQGFYGFDPGREEKREAPKAKTNYAGRDWWVVIGCSKMADRAAIKSAYRKRAMEIHQKELGEDALKELNVAKDLAFKLVLS